ncbi:hypothetical protein V6N13_113618 [Hibiscus sabdariffa]
MQSSISSRFNFKVVDTLRIYLGVPVIHKRTCCSDYEFIIVKILNKLNGWSARSLYDKWCVNLTRYVLDSLLFHSILCKPVPFLSKCAIPLKFLFVVSFGSTLTTLKGWHFSSFREASLRLALRVLSLVQWQRPRRLKLYKLNYGGLLSGLQVARSLSAKKLLVQSDSSTDVKMIKDNETHLSSFPLV